MPTVMLVNCGQKATNPLVRLTSCRSTAYGAKNVLSFEACPRHSSCAAACWAALRALQPAAHPGLIVQVHLAELPDHMSFFGRDYSPPEPGGHRHQEHYHPRIAHPESNSSLQHQQAQIHGIASVSEWPSSDECRSRSIRSNRGVDFSVLPKAQTRAEDQGEQDKCSAKPTREGRSGNLYGEDPVGRGSDHDASQDDNRRRNSYTWPRILSVVTFHGTLFVQWLTSFLLNDGDSGPSAMTLLGRETGNRLDYRGNRLRGAAGMLVARGS